MSDGFEHNMIIYRAYNTVNDKSYIGKSKHLLKDLKLRHERSIRNKKLNTYFVRALRKYGWDKFEWSIIDSSAKTEEELNQLEIKYIAAYKSQYNMTSGGEGVIGYKYTQEVKDKMSEAAKNRSLNHKAKISKANKGREPWNKGLKGKVFHSEETKEKIRLAATGRKHSPESIDKITTASRAYRSRIKNG